MNLMLIDGTTNRKINCILCSHAAAFSFLKNLGALLALGRKQTGKKEYSLCLKDMNNVRKLWVKNYNLHIPIKVAAQKILL